MTVELEDKIVSSNLNHGFSRAAVPVKWLNTYDHSYLTQTISFQGIGLNSLYTEDDAYTEYWRAPDNLDVMAIVVDLFGVDQMGINSLQGAASSATAINARGLDFKLEVRGNYRALDEEEGYPQIYKSSEFNMVTDIDMSFDKSTEDIIPLLTTTATSTNPLSQFGHPVWSGDTGLDRRIFFPVNQNEILLSFLRGSQYIFTLSAKDLVVPIKVGSTTEVRVVHDVTAINMSFVCRNTTRRYS